MLFAHALLAQSNTAMLNGIGTWQSEPIFTVGENINAWNPPGKLDGMGARRVGNTMELFVNHELSSAEGATYALQNGLQLKGGRITKFLVDIPTRTVISSGLAYERIYDRTGALVTTAQQINETSNTVNGLDRPCSASLFKAGTKNLVDEIFITGEESPNGQAFVLDVANNDLYCAPWLGRATWENAALLQHPDPSRIALLVGDDTAGAPLYLYVGEKDHFGNNSFLDRNGMAYGTLYVFVADGGFLSPQHVNDTGTRFYGTFQPIVHFDPSQSGNSGSDAQGFADQSRQYILGNAIGMFRFSRPEDVAPDPNHPNRVVMASTGRGDQYPADDWGTTYIMDVDLTDLSIDVHIIYDGDDAGAGQFTHPDHGLRSPDNLEWACDGSIYVQEDRSTSLNTFGGVSGMEASIWKIDPLDGVLQRIAMVNRNASYPPGQYDNAQSIIGYWETSGILDVTELMNVQDEIVLLATVQAHSVFGGAITQHTLVNGGQILFLTKPASDLQLSVRALFDGPYESATGVMRDDLRANGLIPLQQPFTSAPISYQGTESIHPTVLSRAGNDAIVDWVLIELRNAGSPGSVIAQRAGLIERDGDVVDVDGISPVRFTGMAPGNYFVSLRHRNHLGVMTETPMQLFSIATDLDLTSTTIANHGTNAQRQTDGVRRLWAGDVNGNGNIRYAGNGNDRDPILFFIGGQIPSATVAGYHSHDTDLDGVVRYTGADNDRDIILESIGGMVPTAVRTQQLP